MADGMVGVRRLWIHLLRFSHTSFIYTPSCMLSVVYHFPDVVLEHLLYSSILN